MWLIYSFLYTLDYILWVQEQRLEYWLRMMWRIRMIKLQVWVSLGTDCQTPDPQYNLQSAQHLCAYYCNNRQIRFITVQ